MNVENLENEHGFRDGDFLKVAKELPAPWDGYFEIGRRYQVSIQGDKAVFETRQSKLKLGVDLVKEFLNKMLMEIVPEEEVMAVTQGRSYEKFRETMDLSGACAR